MAAVSTPCWQFYLLVWKGLIIRRRLYVRTLFEILIPLALFCMFVFLRTQVSELSKNEKHGATTFPTYQPMPYVAPGRTRWLFCPNTSYTSSLVKHAMASVDPFKELKADLTNEKRSCKRRQCVSQGFPSEAALISEAEDILSNSGNLYSIVGLVFDIKKNDSKINNSKSLKYSIRMVDQFPGFFTDEMYPALSFNGPNRADTAYTQSGFLGYQAAVEQAFIKMQDKQKILNQWNIVTTMQAFPYPSFYDQTNLQLYLRFVAMVIVYGFLLMSVFFVRRIVDEKANRAKELMRIMGLNDLVYYSGTFFNTFIFMALILTLAAILFKIPVSDGLAVISYSDGSLIWILFMLYAVQSLLFCITISVFFNKSVLASIMTAVLWSLVYLLPANIMDPSGQNDTYMSYTKSQKLATSIFPNAALHWAFRIIGFYEAKDKEGCNWNNISTIPDGDNFNLSMIMGTMAGSCLLYASIIWYVDNVWPWQFGIPKHPLYLFMPSYWFPRKVGLQRLVELDNPDVEKSYFEDEPHNMTAGISITHLSKVYGSGSGRKVAVNDVSINMYRGQITALLGHNGAGKTTTMSVVTGIFPPTSGYATVNGYNIVTNLKQARRSLGLCPQHNVLYDMLTVEEHLLFFAGLKGLSFAEARPQIASCLKMLELENKRQCLSKALSGGMKRKLSLGIAMIGDTEVLILDEPTSGMDPQARRAIWDVLHQIKEQKTIVLTTHYMEEADILGDRIAIMAEGTLQCCGSPLFLKRKFGAGYHLRVSKGESFRHEKLREVVHRSVPSAYVDNEMRSDVSYVLPVNDSGPFITMFEDLERNKSELGYTACGLTITTMEDVFLKVGQMSSNADHKTQNSEALVSDGNHYSSVNLGQCSFQVPPQSRLTGYQLWLHQVRGLLIKRFHDSRRYIPFLFFLIILPFLIILVMLIVRNQISKNIIGSSLEPIELDIGTVYGPTKAYYNTTGNDILGLLTSYVDVLTGVEAEPQLSSNPLGDVLNVGEQDFQTYKHTLLVGGQINVTKRGIEILGFQLPGTQVPTIQMRAMYNEEAYHSSAISLNLMNNALLRTVTGDNESVIQLTNAPIKNLHKNDFDITVMVGGILLSFFMPLAMSFLSSSFVLFPIHERQTKSKLIQMMTGVDGLTFWVTHFLWDFAMHLLASCFMLIPFVAMDKNRAYAFETGATGTMFLMLIVYGWSSIPLSYLLSFLTKKPSTGFNVTMAVNFITGMILTMALTVSKLVLTASKKDISWVEKVAWLCRLLPNFSISWGTSHLDTIANQNVFCDNAWKNNKDLLTFLCGVLDKNSTTYPQMKCCPEDVCGDDCFHKRAILGMDETQCGRDLLLMFLSGILFFAMLAFMESNAVRFWYRVTDKKKGALANCTPSYLETQMSGIALGEDPDVSAERTRVEDIYKQGKTNQEAILACNLTKTFGSLVAVDHVTFAVHHNECFGLLGVNGAGKTTTFSMLTGDLTIGEGTAVIGKSSVKDDLKMFQRQVGYCPQFDALLDRLTGRESLYLFARLRGVPEKDIPRTVSSMIDMVDLKKHADKMAHKYSGGNRRKLSLALSLVGSPPVVFLDEPTAGVDPASRRKIWTALTQVQQSGGTSFILTTHSMEECEALCGRLVIMVNGQFRCLGPIQYLKHKFGQGYTIIVKLRKNQHLDPQATLAVQQFFHATFPGSALKDVHQGMLHYHIVDTTISWSRLFREMERAKKNFDLEDFLISDTTLEQIFLTFAKSQRMTSTS